MIIRIICHAAVMSSSRKRSESLPLKECKGISVVRVQPIAFPVSFALQSRAQALPLISHPTKTTPSNTVFLSTWPLRSPSTLVGQRNPSRLRRPIEIVIRRLRQCLRVVVPYIKAPRRGQFMPMSPSMPASWQLLPPKSEIEEP